MFTELRKKYISRYYWNRPSMHKFISLIRPRVGIVFSFTNVKCICLHVTRYFGQYNYCKYMHIVKIRYTFSADTFHKY